MSAGGLSVGVGYVDIKVRFPDLGQASRRLAQGLGDAGRGVGVGLGAALRGVSPNITALGRALNGTTRGFGTGLGAALRGTASPIRAMGSAFSGIVRSFGGALSGVLRGAAGLVRSLSSLLRAALSPLRLLTGGGGLLGLAGGIGAGGTAFFTAREAMNRENATADLARLTGLRGAPLESLMGGLRNRASMTGAASLEDVLGTAKMGAKMGIQGNSLGLFVKDMTDIKAAISDIPLEEFSERTSRLMGIFGYGAKDTRRFASAMVALDNASTASARDILDISTRLAPMANALGLSAQKTLALSAAAREAGINPETAGTALSQILGKMANPANHGAFAKVAGVDSASFGAMAKSDPLEALKAVAKGIGGMDSAQAIQALNGLHLSGARTQQTLLALSATMGKLDAYTKISANDFSSMSAIEDAAALKTNTASAAMEKLWNNLKLAGGEIGTAMLPAIKGMAEGFGNLARDVREWGEANQGWLTGWGSKIGNAVRMVGVLGREWRTFMAIGGSFAREGIDNFKIIAKQFGDAIWANLKWVFSDALPKLIVNTIGGLASVFGDLFSKAMKRAGEEIQNMMAANLPSWMGGGEDKVIPLDKMTKVGIDASLMGDVTAGIGKAPGFSGVFDNLTSRADERKPLWDRLGRSLEGMDRQNRREEAMQGLQDAFTRTGIGEMFTPKGGAGAAAGGMPADFHPEVRSNITRRRMWERHLRQQAQARAATRRNLGGFAPYADALGGFVSNAGSMLGDLAGGVPSLTADALTNPGKAAGDAAGAFAKIADKIGGLDGTEAIKLLTRIADRLDRGVVGGFGR